MEKGGSGDGGWTLVGGDGCAGGDEDYAAVGGAEEGEGGLDLWGGLV